MTVAVDSSAMVVRPDARTDVQFEDLEQYRRELTGYAYRMLGSAFEADDAVQETMVRAWKALDSFEGRSAVRSWLYRIATNVCLDMLRGRQRRARAMDIGGPYTADAFKFDTLPEQAWMTPIPDAKVLPESGDPAELAAERETIRLAFVAALQHLPPRQRAVLILREVLRWQATEVAELLDTSVPSVNSALQRARATMAERELDDTDVRSEDAEQQELLARYVDAFERYDIESLVALLREDAVMTMPPFNFWVQGPVEMGKFFVGPGHECEGSRLIATTANGAYAYGSYKPDPAGGYMPWSVQVIEIAGDRIVAHHNFIDTDARLLEVFGLPARLS